MALTELAVLRLPSMGVSEPMVALLILVVLVGAILWSRSPDVRKRWLMVSAGLIASAVALIVIAVALILILAPDEERTTQRQRITAQPAQKLPCSARDRRLLVEALRDGFSGEVAASVNNLRCSDTFAYGTVCILCRPPDFGPSFGVLLVRETDSSWRYLGSGDPTAIEQLADDAGLDRLLLDELRGPRPRY